MKFWRPDKNKTAWHNPDHISYIEVKEPGGIQRLLVYEAGQPNPQPAVYDFETYEACSAALERLWNIVG